MKTIVFTFLLLCSFQAKCDTLDFYHVYLNDSLIAKFNFFSESKSIALKAAELKETDVLTVRYFTDAPSPHSVYILSVLLEVMESTPEARANSNFGKMSIPISQLLYYRDKYELSRYPFNFLLDGGGLNKYSAYLFTLEIL